MKTLLGKTKTQPQPTSGQMVDCLLGKNGSNIRQSVSASVVKTVREYGEFMRYIQTTIIYQMLQSRSSAEKAEFTITKMGLKEFLIPCISIFTDWYKPLHKVLGDVTLDDIVLPFPKVMVSMTINRITYTAVVTQESLESKVVVEQLIGHDQHMSEILTEAATIESRETHMQWFIKYFVYAMIASEVNLAESVSLDTPRLDGSANVDLNSKGYEYRILPIRKSNTTCHGSTDTGAKKRFHFRRAHIRTYEDGKKVRINWTFVGDIELGFVDKDYVI